MKTFALALGSGGARGGTNGIGGFRDQQRLIAGDQVNSGQTSGQCRGQLFGAYTQLIPRPD